LKSVSARALYGMKRPIFESESVSEIRQISVNMNEKKGVLKWSEAEF